MKTVLRGLVVAALVGGGVASAQIRVEIGVPTIQFEVRPPLVTVSTGIQVVPDYDEEVFFTDGYYWTRRDDRWYRCQRDWRWEPVEVRRVPVGIVRIPPGHYRHWHRGRHEVMPVSGHADRWDRDDRDGRHDYDRDDRHDHDRDDRHDDDHGDHDHGHGHGHGHGRH